MAGRPLPLSQFSCGPLSPTLPDLPRVPLIRAPTPLVAAERLAHAIGMKSLYVKREDLSGFAMGGNKPRQLEAIIAHARSTGADTLVTTAAAQSNFCQATAAAAAHLGLRCILLLRREGEAVVQGNLLLDHVFGAEIEFLDTADPYDPVIPGRLADIAERIRAENGHPYVVHLPGRTGPLTAASATSLAAELARQFGDLDEFPAKLFLAAGSGLTAAGIALGFKHLGVPTRVVGIAVQKPAAFLGPLMVERGNQAADLLGIATRLEADDFDLDDRFIGPGYGKPSQASLDAVALAGRYGALVVDPGYSGKALAGLIELQRHRRQDASRSAVFVHTGGAASVFLHADRVHRHVKRMRGDAARAN